MVSDAQFALVARAHLQGDAVTEALEQLSADQIERKFHFAVV